MQDDLYLSNSAAEYEGQDPGRHGIDGVPQPTRVFLVADVVPLVHPLEPPSADQ